LVGPKFFQRWYLSLRVANNPLDPNSHNRAFGKLEVLARQPTYFTTSVCLEHKSCICSILSGWSTTITSCRLLKHSFQTVDFLLYTFHQIIHIFWQTDAIISLMRSSVISLTPILPSEVPPRGPKISYILGLLCITRCVCFLPTFCYTEKASKHGIWLHLCRQWQCRRTIRR
jgi:hypothetical protein